MSFGVPTGFGKPSSSSAGQMMFGVPINNTPSVNTSSRFGTGGIWQTIGNTTMTINEHDSPTDKIASISSLYDHKSHEELRSEDYLNIKGSRRYPYATTRYEEEIKETKTPIILHSISAMPIYKNKSHEELRFEDYGEKAKGVSGAPLNITHPQGSRPSPFAPFGIPSTNPFSPSTNMFTPQPQTPTTSTTPTSSIFPSLFPHKSTPFTTKTIQPTDIFPPTPTNTTTPTPQPQPFMTPNNSNIVVSTPGTISEPIFHNNTTNVFDSRPSTTSPNPSPLTNPFAPGSQPFYTPAGPAPTTTVNTTSPNPSPLINPFASGSQPFYTPTGPAPTSTVNTTSPNPSPLTNPFAPGSKPLYTPTGPALTTTVNTTSPNPSPLTHPFAPGSQPFYTPTGPAPTTTVNTTSPNPSPLTNPFAPGSKPLYTPTGPALTTTVNTTRPNPSPLTNPFAPGSQPFYTPTGPAPTTTVNTTSPNPSTLTNPFAPGSQPFYTPTGPAPTTTVNTTSPNPSTLTNPFAPGSQPFYTPTGPAPTTTVNPLDPCTPALDISQPGQTCTTILGQPSQVVTSIIQPEVVTSTLHGISSLPVKSNHSVPVRMSSLYRIRHLSSRRVSLPANRYNSESTVSKVPFFGDKEYRSCLVAPFIPRENPRSWVTNKSSEPEHAPNDTYKEGETCENKGAVSSCFQVNESTVKVHNNTSLQEKSCLADEPLVSSLMPKLPCGEEYYTEPSIEELEAKERAEPGFCSCVKNFVVGRKDKGSIKFLEETDIRHLDLESIVQFNDREVIVYKDDENKPPIGQGLNRPAEVTLLNVKFRSKTSGKQFSDGHQVQEMEKMLTKKTNEQGAEFVSYNPVRGEWKFRVEHF